MATHAEKANALAEKIEAKASGALDGLEREMLIMKWPAEFRAIMWEAVVAIASRRAIDARMSDAER